MKKTARLLVLVLALPLVMLSCGKSAPPDIVQAADAMHEMLTPSSLSRSMFSAAFPKGKPSQFVSYLFSDMGVAEWPPSQGSATPMEIEQMKAIRKTMLPDGVAIVPKAPDKSRGRQIVMAYDDPKGIVVILGYVDPKKKPVLLREILLPNVDPAPGIAMMYNSNKQLGMTSQAF